MARRRRPRASTTPKDSLGRAASWATIVGVPIALVALAVSLMVGGGGGGSVTVSTATRVAPAALAPSEPGLTTVPPPHLERVDMIVRNSWNGLPGPVFEDRPELEVLLHNVGTGRSIVSRGQIEVLHRYDLPVCFTQGGIPLSSSYGAQLSPTAQSGDIFDVPLHEQLGPDQPDRFTIKLGMTPGTLGGGFYVFDLRLSLAHDGDRRRLRIGRALVSIPYPPLRDGTFLSAGEARHMNHDFNWSGKSLRQFWARPMACWRKNTRLMERALASASQRSQELDESLDRVILTPRFSDLEPRPAVASS